MCGIVGYIGNKKALPILIDGLETLEYRGYDSAGVGYILNNETHIVKEKGKLENLIKKLNFDTDTFIGIGHTRWATHGIPDNINAHPHRQGKVTLIHNGIIENYEELKKELNYDFKTQTDSEVIAALIDNLYNGNMLETLVKVKEKLIGSYALGILIDGEDKIYAIRKNSPLIVASSNDGNFIASDVPAILKYTNKYILLEQNEIAVLSKNNIDFYNDNLELINKETLTFDGDFMDACRDGYEHFMLKEINEEAKVFKNTISVYKDLPDFSKYNKIEIVGCGSAYHAGLIGKNLIEKYADIEVNVYIASEYRYSKQFHDKNTLVIFISQSGETADTLACLNKVKNEGIDSLGIINVRVSAIARDVTNVIYTKAGCEIAVATTKAYLSQITVLSLIALKMANIDINSIDIDCIPEKIEKLINLDYSKIANKLYKNNDIYFLGRGIDYSLALEGSLKLKEISYIHSEAYASGELKHGTIALINKDTPVIYISTTRELNDKTISNVKEVKARGAYVIGITTIPNSVCDDMILIDEVEPLLQPILTVIPLQMISYHVAKLKGCDIDKPKNLAKSVTVE